VCEHWPSRVPGQYNETDTGTVSVVQVLPPNAPTPTTDQLAAIQQTFQRYGYASWPRVLDRLWFGYPVLSAEQQKALAGIE
jgi:hypothetical protein